MSADRTITLYHWPHSRSAGVHALLEELGAPYELQVVNLDRGEQRQPAHLAVNPMGKIPAIRHGDVVVTEQVAIYLYLADLFPEAGLAPAPTDPLRGPYLRWMVFYAASFEPGMMDIALKREAPPASMSPYGTADTMLETLRAHLAESPYMAGERFTAADVLWGTALRWMTGFKLLPETSEITAYLQRVSGRPATARAEAANARIMAKVAGEAGTEGAGA